jgi:hypothetical protein
MNHFLIIEGDQLVPVHLSVFHMRAATHKTVLNIQCISLSLLWLITGFLTILTRRVPHVEQELLTLPEHQSSPPMFSEVRVARSFFYIMFCRSLFVILYFFFWPLCCLLFFDLRILITHSFGISKLFLDLLEVISLH